MRRWISNNPWIWIVAFFLFVIGANLAFFVIAEYNKPILIEKTAD